jgi:phenylalanyl-tRNA synthetase beta chain
MKYSFSLGQYYSKQDLSKILSLSKTELAEKLNSQIGAFDEIIDWGARYDGVYVVKIVKLEKHPDADKLNVCLIDDGKAAKNVERNKEGLIQVVCGAPNVKEGMIVAWVSPGATVPSTYADKEPFVLSKIKLRGVESNGMLASKKELNISSDHDGIFDLESSEIEKDLLKPGTPFKMLFGLEDIIVDFENKMFTHRPDCFGHLGISREIAGIQKINFEAPDWYKSSEPKLPSSQSKLKLEIDNQIPELVPRYTAVCIEGIKIESSPVWLQSYLTRLGIKPINNMVDVTNYMMILTGQPLHAFDYDKVKSANGSKISVRTAAKGEKLKILNGKDILLDPSDIVITNGNYPIALGGVMGGANSEVDDNTTSIILESATFDMYAIRRTSMRHGLFTDAVTRYTKGQPEAQTAVVLLKAMQMIKELVPESKVGEVLDLQNEKFEYDHLTIKVDKINKILGLSLSREQISEILNYVEISSHQMLDEVCVTPPFWRTDLELDEDIIEEVGRLYGFNKIRAELPTRKVSPSATNQMVELKKSIRNKLSSFGANEILTYSFVSTKLIEKAGQNPEMAFKIRNALSPDLQAYRLSLIPNVIEKVHQNIKSGVDEFAIYEIGKCHIKEHLEPDSGLPQEFQRLALVYASKKPTDGSAFYFAKKYLAELLDSLNLTYNFIELGPEMFSPNVPITSVYQQGRSAGVEIEGELRGVIGEFSVDVQTNFKLPESSAGFEIDLDWLVDKFNEDPSYSPLNKFPSITQDLTIVSKSTQTYKDVLTKLNSSLENFTKKSGIKFSISPTSIFQKDESKPKNLTFNIEFWHPERTLNTKEIAKFIESVK